MWRLIPAESGTGPISLLAGKEYVVGRKNCDVLLSNDQSISRVHAHITVTEQAVTLKDSSKYGTSVNDKRLETGATKTVYAGDKLTFGVFQSKFRLELDSVVVCSSCVDNEGKAALSKEVQALGGRLVNTWSQECTHLVMPTVKITIKTICALLCCRPIVKPQFFTELSRAVRQRENLPKAQSFRPEIDEPSLSKEKVDLGPRQERKTLFAGKTFVFLNSKQMKRLSQAISFGGGKSQLLEEGALPVSLLESKKTCVVDVTTGSSQPLIPPTTKKFAESISLILQRNGLRFIAESEIGLATIYVNNQTHCNPCSSLDSESVKMRPAIPEATLSQNAAVDETVLHGGSLNITAYVVNTEPSQSFSRKDICGTTAVGETPEKRSTNPTCPTSSKKPPRVPEPPAACSEPVSSSFSEVQEEKRSNSEGQKSDRCAKFTSPLSSATFKKSPQKQVSLTSYFKPTNKKRLREGSTDSELPEVKLSRLEDEGSKEAKNSNVAPSLKSSSTRLGSQTGQNQQNTTSRCSVSGSLGLGSGLATDSRSGSGKQNRGLDLDLDLNFSSKKRKEPEQDPAAPADLDVSLEELESIMSVDMDEPLQPTANKKQCLEQGERSTASAGGDCSGIFSKQKRAEEHRSTSWSSSWNSEKDRQESTRRGSERKPRLTASTSQGLEREQHSSSHRIDDCETLDVKEEQVSFLLETKVKDGSIKHNEEAAIKEESMGSSSGSGPEKDPDLPRKLLQVQFMSLTMSAPSRTRTEPLQSRDRNGKNFKHFRKVPVPGILGLPKIIGGSDLVAHNRSKNSELEEWLKDAAEQEKHQEREETLGDDLFRYNPKTVKRR
ncbi:nibrin [Clarias gariepinus]|uniref:nibrin n=1 Tax=Clarias gariepinus TaxID=13013 RepID=UPI00234C4941|nr:nibrin [Clarias gariepinus]